VEVTPKKVQAGLAVLLAALLVTPLVYKRLVRHDTTSTSDNASTALARYGFHFQESAKASGIDFIHKAPTLDV